MAAPTMREAIEIIRKPFSVGEVEWRIQTSGEKGDKPPWAIVVPYITARAAHERLDEAFDAWGWRTEFRVMEVPGGKPGIICRLHYFNPTMQEWEWKENGAGQTQIEPFKGGLSDAEKRAFEQLGGGRYLYALGTQFAETSRSKSEKCPEWAKTKKDDRGGGGVVFYWGPPLLPEHAIPGVRAAVNEESKAVMGEPLEERIEYPRFDIFINSMARRQGVSELRGARSFAREMKWDDDTLIEFAKSIGVDLHDLNKESCIKLRDMMRNEKNEVMSDG